MYVPLRKAVEILGLHANTLRKYADQGKIKSIKNEAGQRLFDVRSYVDGATRTALICYTRVSSRKQLDDLERQVSFMQSFYPGAEIIQDIGSGINFKRKGLRAILDRLLQGDKLTLVVAHRDSVSEKLSEIRRVNRLSDRLKSVLAMLPGKRIAIGERFNIVEKLKLKRSRNLLKLLRSIALSKSLRIRSLLLYFAAIAAVRIFPNYLVRTRLAFSI